MQVVQHEEPGSSILYQMVDAAREWVSAYPMCVDPEKAATSSDTKNEVVPIEAPICKFFLQGKCRFGDRCNNCHEKGRSPAVSGGSNTTSKNDVGGASQLMKTKKQKANTETTYQHSQFESEGKGNGSRAKKTQRNGEATSEGVEKKPPLRTASDVISRILWDPDLMSEEFTVGYIDRFTGIVEKPFSAFSWEDIATVGINVLAIPKHRIQYFKYRNEIVWDKPSQLDNFFGSRGGKVIQDIVTQHAAGKDDNVQERGEQNEPECGEKDGGERGFGEMDIELDEDWEKEGHGEGANALQASIHTDRNRPTHFVCFHITNSEVKTNVAKIQSHITTLSPQLSNACLAVTALHVTLNMIRLENDQQIEKACEVLKCIRVQFIHMLPRCLQLTFTGISNFRERLVYVKVAPCLALEKFVVFLMNQFKAAGLRTPGNHEEYTPHMTILKLSRPMQRELPIGLISPALYLPFQNMCVGSEHVDSLFLCAVTAPKQPDGFFLRLAHITNSLSGLSPHFISLLTKRLHFLYERGVLTEDERDTLTERIQTNDTKSGEHSFDSTVEEIAQLGREETMCSRKKIDNQSVVVILRGVPGSGKSFLSTHCSEYLNSPTKVAMCGADSYFVESEKYVFSPALLPKAHSHCLEQALQALDEGKELIIIDNTNSKLWEYSTYIYICSILGCQYHVLEVPCPSPQVLEMFRSRNIHYVDSVAAKKIYCRWETDEGAALIPPSLALPRNLPSSYPSFSLMSLCLPEGAKTMQALETYTSIKAVYIAVFLTIESQWHLLAAITPTHSLIHGEHITLSFEPGKHMCLEACIGRRVSVKVTGIADNGKLQVARVNLPQGISSQNMLPHITISREENVSAKTANQMLKTQTIKPFYSILLLEGIIGVVVREGNDLDLLPSSSKPEEKLDINSQPTFVLTSETDFLNYVLPKQIGAPGKKVQSESIPQSDGSASNVHICTGDQKITQLYVFDFDGTLFNTPEPKTGRELYEKCSGKKWDRKGWLSWPESLLPPIRSTSGPALPEFRQHIGRAGSLTVIITGRIERTKSALVQVLENFQVYPERLLLKPDSLDETTAYFKSRAFQQLLEEFLDVTLVKFWDDLPENLSVIHSLSKSYKHIQFDIIDATNMLPTRASKHGKKTTLQSPVPNASKIPQPSESLLQLFLDSYDFLPTVAYTAAAICGKEFLAKQYSKAIEFSGDPTLLVYIFGSFPLGRKGDLDMCFLGPQTSTPTDCMERLFERLVQCGISYVYKGYSKRCPRLKVMLEFPTCPPVNYDIVFATISDMNFFSHPVDVQLPAAKALSLIKPGDTASKAALAGPVLLYHILGEIDGAVTKEQFGGTVEMVVQTFIAQRQKGNAYHCIRTFHIVRLLAEFIKAQRANLQNVNCDLLFEEFVSHAAKLPHDKWKKLFGDFVPCEYIPKVIKTFSKIAREVSYNSDPSLACYEELIDRSSPYPPEGYTAVEIMLSGFNKVALWKLHTIAAAKLPLYIRQLISSGIDVLPSGDTENERKFCFAVPHTKSVKQTLQQILRPFWNEIEEYRKEKGVRIELRFGKATNSPESTASQSQPLQTVSLPIMGQIEEFASDQARAELHLSPKLKSYERLLAHETCERLSLHHTATGSGSQRHIVIRKTK